MTWMKVDVGAPSHPKIVLVVKAAGGAAGWFWFCGTAYARAHSTDGFLADGVLSEIAPGMKAWKALPAALVTARLWSRVEGGYQIHDFAEWHPTKADLDQKRADDALRKREAREEDRRRRDGARPGNVQVDVHQDSERTDQERPFSHARDRAGAGASLPSPLSPDGRTSSDLEGGLGETAAPVPAGRVGVADRYRAIHGQTPLDWERKHRSHALRGDLCDWVCLPDALYADWLNRLTGAGATREGAAADIRAWALDVRARWVGRVPGDDNFAFWRNEWAATHGSNRPSSTPKPGAGLDALIAAGKAGRG